MLKIWSNAKLFRVGVQVYMLDNGTFPCSHLVRYDPLLRLFTSRYRQLIVPMDPLSESGLFDGSFHDDVSPTVFTSKPVNSRVKDSTSYDQATYGSFLDSVQSFIPTLQGTLNTSRLKKVFSQHNVRHKTFKGRAFSSVIDLPREEAYHGDVESLLGLHINLPYIPSASYEVAIYPSGVVDYLYGTGWGSYDVSPLFTYLMNIGSHQTTYILDGATFDTTISNFTYSCTDRLSFDYDAETVETAYDGVWHYSYHFYYRGDPVSLYGVSGTNPKVEGPAILFARYGSSSSISDYPGALGIWEDTRGATYAPVISIPSDSAVTDSITETVMSKRLYSIASSFWRDSEIHNMDITALSRDTATLALTRLSSQAFEPSLGRIGALNPLKVAGDSLVAKTADAALKDAQMNTIKSILRPSGGAKLVKYRIIFSDLLQLTNALEVLGSLRSEPSRLYTANAHYEYPVILGDRDCIIHVRSKVYLELSPYRLLQIFIGREAILILNDLLALYYSSQPLGEILLTLLQLRRIGDYISGRMFYNLPIFFVHTYSVEYQLSQADLDYVGISNVVGDPARITYYMRDVSEHLPVLRFSNLAAFYGTGDVGDIVWTLLQQLAGVLSSSI